MTGRWRQWGWGLMVLALSANAGCLRRRLTIRTDPPGAVVYIDRRPEPIGVSPVSTPFTYYGTRQIQVMKDGYETVTIRQRFSPPWYEIPPLDFFVENLWPREIRDERVVDVHLEPQRRVPADEVLNRARQLKQNTYQGIATPLPAPPANQPPVYPLPSPATSPPATALPLPSPPAATQPAVGPPPAN